MSVNYEVIEKIDPRVKRTKALIEQTFTRLISEKGFSSITVQNITEEAEINRATFYAHYADKFELLETILRAKFKELMDSRALSTCMYEQRNLSALMITVCEFIQLSASNCAATDVSFENMVENQARKHIFQILRNWVDQIWPSDDVKKNIRATAATWEMYGLAQHWVKDRSLRNMSAEDFTASALPYITAALHTGE